MVLLSGPRQSGKTALAADIPPSDRHYVMLDNHATLIDRAFATQVLQARRVILGKQLIETVLCDGYAEPLGRKEWIRKQDWFDSYLETLARRDVQDIGRLDQAVIMQK